MMQLTFAPVTAAIIGAPHIGFAATGLAPAGAQEEDLRSIRFLQYSMAILPAMVSWTALGLMPDAAYTTLLLTHATAAVGDAVLGKCGVTPAWWSRLRLNATLLIFLSLGASYFVISNRGDGQEHEMRAVRQVVGHSGTGKVKPKSDGADGVHRTAAKNEASGSGKEVNHYDGTHRLPGEGEETAK